MPTLLVLVGHPDRQSFTSALADSYAQRALQDGAQVERLHLADLRFDPVLRQGQPEQALEPDLLRARDAIVRAAHVAWFFPTWWAAPPALVKGFVDRVFLPGFAYRYRSRFEQPEKLLAGRSARLVTSMDSPAFWYTLVHRRALHASFGGGTLGFVGFAPVRTTTFYELRFMDEARRHDGLAQVQRAAAEDVAALARRRPRNSAEAARLPAASSAP
jgi:NAD(P)H dehydrogenase (quinone)